MRGGSISWVMAQSSCSGVCSRQPWEGGPVRRARPLKDLDRAGTPYRLCTCAHSCL